MNIPVSAVNPQKQEALNKRLEKLNVREEDILEKFVRAQGPGGQKVNKSSSCVYLKHLPTGIEIKCQQERSQALNRFFARRILADKLEELILKKKSQKQREIARIRKQKRKRSKRAKEKMLKDKKLRGEKKKLRANVTIID